MSKGTMAESLKDRIELVYKDYRYNKAKVEKFYFDNFNYCKNNIGLDNTIYIKTFMFIFSCIWMGYSSGLFLHYTWKNSSEWSYIETWAIMYAMFRIGYVYGYEMDGWIRRVERGNYDKDILNEVGSKNNPIDLTKDDGNETEEESPDKEELTEEEKKKKEEFVKEKEKEIAEIMNNLKRQIPEDEEDEEEEEERYEDEDADEKMVLVSEKMEELKKLHPDWSEDKVYDTAYDYVHIHSNCVEDETIDI